MRVFRATDSAGTSVVVTVDDSGVLHGSTEPEIGALFGLRLGYRGILRRHFHPREFDVVELTSREADAARKAVVPARDDLNHDIRQVLSAAIVAGRAGVSEDVAAAAIDAYLYATTIVAVSGAPVVGVATNVIGPDGCAYTEYLREHIDELLEGTDSNDDDFDLFEFLKPLVPASLPVPRLRPVFESELIWLAVDLAKTDVPEADPERLFTTIAAWSDLVDENIDGGVLDLAVVRRSWYRLEHRFEIWLSTHLDRIGFVGLELLSRQWRTPAGGIADLVCLVNSSFTDDISVGDVFVIENKATVVVPPDVDQVLRYMPSAKALASRGDAEVHGLVAGPSIAGPTWAYANDLGVDTITWGEVGYFDYLWIGDDSSTPIRDEIYALSAHE